MRPRLPRRRLGDSELGLEGESADPVVPGVERRQHVAGDWLGERGGRLAEG